MPIFVAVRVLYSGNETILIKQKYIFLKLRTFATIVDLPGLKPRVATGSSNSVMPDIAKEKIPAEFKN